MIAAAGATVVALVLACRAEVTNRRARRRLDCAGDATVGPSLPTTALRHASPATVLGLAGSLAAALALGAAGVVVSVVMAVAAMPVRRRIAAARLRAVRASQLPEGLERVAAALRAGASLPGAIAEAGRSLPDPLGPELAGVAAATRRGRLLVDALDDWAGARSDAATRSAATVLIVAAGAGAAPARAVDGLAATLRERAQIAAERRALATQARWSALVLSVSPLVVAVLLGVSGSAAGRFLFGTPAGWTCLGCGLAADAAGAWWMTSLTQGADR
jgi:tight adherence protein B